MTDFLTIDSLPGAGEFHPARGHPIVHAEMRRRMADGSLLGADRSTQSDHSVRAPSPAARSTPVPPIERNPMAPRLAVIATRGLVSAVAAAALVGAGSGVAFADIPVVGNLPVVGGVVGGLPVVGGLTGGGLPGVGSLPTGGLLGGGGTGSLPNLPGGLPGTPNLPQRQLPDASTIPGVTLPAGSPIPSVGGTADPSVDLSGIQGTPATDGHLAINLPPGFPTVPTVPGVFGPCSAGNTRVCVASSDGTAGN
jgi:hypothetical protein